MENDTNEAWENKVLLLRHSISEENENKAKLRSNNASKEEYADYKNYNYLIEC